MKRWEYKFVRAGTTGVMQVRNIDGEAIARSDVTLPKLTDELASAGWEIKHIVTVTDNFVVLVFGRVVEEGGE